jgi:16S rRNA (guanine527-N7)-methyltransferase
MDLASRVDQLAARLEAPLVPQARAAIVAWLELLKMWNARIDLTAAKTDDDLCDVMLTDALVLARRVPFGARVVDVGTGAGAPGLALALARPDLRVALIEPLNKRVAFLRTVIGTLARTDIRLERAKGEDAVRRGEAWDVAISRATLAPAAWLELGAKLVADQGSVWVLLAKEAPPTNEAAEIAEDVSYTLPFAGTPRRAVRFAKRALTPSMPR